MDEWIDRKIIGKEREIYANLRDKVVLGQTLKAL